MHQIQFPLGLRPQTPLRELRALSGPTEPLAVFKGPTSKGREGKREGGREGERKGNERVGEGMEGRGWDRKEGKGGKRGEWEQASIAIFESRRLC